MRLAVVLGNLGGPDSLQAVRPFLYSLFNDPAIIGLPQPLRSLLAGFIAKRRSAVAAEIYARMGGASPLLPETQAQARALEALLKSGSPADETRVFIAMRYWHPLTEDTAAAVKAWQPDRVVLLPLYPQYSGTTTGSFFEAWDSAAKRAAFDASVTRLCCYPRADGFIEAHAALLRAALARAPADRRLRILFSAHGLPRRVVERGDPYAWQIEETARAVMAALGGDAPDWRVCYQSRVGPLPWLTPYTDAEIRRAGEEGLGLVVVPIAFVSEHSETLVELDQDYGALAEKVGVRPYLRVPALGVQPRFIEALATLVLDARTGPGMVAAAGARHCPAACRACPLPSSSLSAAS